MLRLVLRDLVLVEPRELALAHLREGRCSEEAGNEKRRDETAGAFHAGSKRHETGRWKAEVALVQTRAKPLGIFSAGPGGDRDQMRTGG
jgi:hypothetical protein